MSIIAQAIAKNKRIQFHHHHHHYIQWVMLKVYKGKVDQQTLNKTVFNWIFRAYHMTVIDQCVNLHMSLIRGQFLPF